MTNKTVILCKDCKYFKEDLSNYSCSISENYKKVANYYTWYNKKSEKRKITLIPETYNQNNDCKNFKQKKWWKVF